MPLEIALVTLVVRDYDQAIDFYTQALGFELIEDTDQGKGKRWVVVRPRGSSGCGFLLAQAVGVEQEAAVGRQTGGRVSFFVYTDECDRDHAAFMSRDVKFVEEPRQEAYGTVAVFLDLYGNRFDLIQRK